LATGIGDYSAQWFEYYAFDAMLRDLIEYAWPLGYTLDAETGERILFRYHLAYFLPTALVGKILGWSVAYHFSFLWASFGLTLALLWFLRICGSTNPLYAVLFLLFGGLDLAGYGLTAGTPNATGISWMQYLSGTFPWTLDFPGNVGVGYYDWWMFNLTHQIPEGKEALQGNLFFFNSALTLLSTSPHHLLPGWVIILMIIHDGTRRNTPSRAPFLWSCLPFCSSVVALGAAPFVAYLVLRNRWAASLTRENIAAILLLVIPILFLMSGTANVLPKSGFLWTFVDVRGALPYMALYYGLEFIIFLPLLISLRRAGVQPSAGWWRMAVVLLLLLPWFVLGEFNDLTTKGAIASQVVLVCCMAAALRASGGVERFRRHRIILICFLILGTGGSVGVLMRAAAFGIDLPTPPLEQTRHLDEAIVSKGIEIQDRPGPLLATWKLLAKSTAEQERTPNEPVMAWDLTGTYRGEEPAWRFLGDQVDHTAEGVVIRRAEEGVFMRLSRSPVPCSSFGYVVIDHDVHTTQGWQPNYAVFFRWGTEESRSDDAADYPPWNFTGLHPYFKVYSNNPYARGEASEFAFELRLRENTHPVDGLVIRVRSVTFLSR
jgi:hypothetical protein